MGSIPQHYRREEGYLIAAAIIPVFLLLLALSIAAPRVAMELKRERELETAHRANQYVRAIRMYYKRIGTYPVSMDGLKKTSTTRFLRQEYLDPLSGKNDWKMILVGQNKTQVKGFFGEDLPGIPPGLGGAAGLTSASPGVASQGTPKAPGGGSDLATGTTTQDGPADAPSGNGLSNAGGPFIGVGVPKTGNAILVVNGQQKYEDWEFLYDPRVEKMYALSNVLGGGISSGNATGLGLTPSGPAPGSPYAPAPPPPSVPAPH